MRLADAPDHLLKHLPGLAHGFGFLHRRKIFIVHGLPIQATELGIPILIANSSPDEFERFEIETALWRGERRFSSGDGSGRGRGEKERECRREPQSSRIAPCPSPRFVF